ncbi:hypothetical protein GGX14DRAFT_407579 [Mycena pura]|uniref:Uncharacterized protein n=1 Tax=Mycena pura TaxID=153505 RepID=A0AAD6Y4A7_9AGAR|nr:hypothetical protein GGX14DRAFT_407579 [Mycena pura]
MVPSKIVRWWLRTAEPPNRRIAEAPDRRVAETPDCRIAETLDLRITGHLSRRTYEAPKVVRRAPEVVRPIVDVGSEKGLRRLVATRRYWDAYGGTGRNVGASGGMRTGGTGCLQAVGCAEQARKGGVPLTSSPPLAVAPRHSVRRPRRTRGKKIRGSLKLQIDLRGFKSPKRRNSERRNAEIPYTEVPKLRNAETSKLQNTEVPKSPKFQRPPGSETPKTRGLRPDMFRGFGRGNAGSSAAVYEESAPGCSGSGGVLERKLKAGVSERSAKDFGGSSAVGTNLRNSEHRSAETPNTEAPKRRNSERRSAEIPNAEAQELRTPKRRNSGHKMAKLRNVKGSCYGSERRNLRNRRNLRDTEAPKSSKTPKISEAIRDVPEALVTSGRTAEVNDQPPAEVRDRPRTCHKGSGKLGIDRIGREGAMAGSVGGSGGKGNGGAFEARPGNHWTSGGAGSARPGQGKKGNENEMAHRAKGWPAEGMGGGVGKGGGEHTATCRTLFSRDPRAHPPASLRRPLHLEHTGRLHGAQSKPGSGRGAEPAGGDLVLLRLGRGESLELATTRQRVSTHLGRGESLENERSADPCVGVADQRVKHTHQGTASGKVHTRGKRSGGTRHVGPRPKGFEIRRSSLKGRKAGQSSGGSGGNLGGLGQRPEGSELRGYETPKRRSSETPKHRNAETPKRRSSEVLKLRNVETLRRRRFWDGEKLRNSETPKRRNAEAPKRRGIVTPRHHGPRSAEGFGGCPAVAVNLRIAEIAEGNRRTPRSPKLRAQRSRDSETGQKHRETPSWARGSGGGSVVAANLRTSESPNRRTAGGHSAHDPEYANLANSSPERGQQPGEEVNLGGVRRKGCHPRGTESGGGGGGDERERAEVEASMVPSKIVRWWLRTAEPPNRRIAEAPDRRVAETPDCRIAETLDLRITGHLSRRTYEAPKVVRRAPEVVRPIVDVGSEKGLRRLVATRRYWDAYGGTGRNVGASGGMRTGGTGCLQAVGCAEQARKGGVPLTAGP